MQDQTLAENATENSGAQQKNEQTIADVVADPVKTVDMKDEREHNPVDQKEQAENPSKTNDVQMKDANPAKSESEKPNN